MNRNFGFTFGRTPEKEEADLRRLERRLAEEPSPQRNTTSPITNPDTSQPAPVMARTPGWLYVPSIEMEFATDLSGLNSNWYDAHKLARQNGCVMPSIAETWELFFYAKANQNKPEFRKVYDFFTRKTPQNTWHGEWQDAFFRTIKKKMLMYKFKGLNAKGEPEFQNPIDITGTYLTSDGLANITQRANVTPNGMLNVADSRNSYVEGENFYSWYPRNEAVARFDAYSGWAVLSCYGNPAGSYASLGVRFARRVAPSVSALSSSNPLQSQNTSQSAQGNGGTK